MKQTKYYGLNKPDYNDHADIATLNENLDRVDQILHVKADLGPDGRVLPAQMPDMDFGSFDEGGVEEHNASPFAHPQLLVDGSVDAASQEESLEAHMASPGAHQNLCLDGNMN